MYQSKTIFQCPNCSYNIIKEEGDETIVRNKILISKKTNNITSVLCPQCGKKIVIPLKVSVN